MAQKVLPIILVFLLLIKLVDSCGVGDIIYTSDNQSAINPYLKFAGSAWPNTIILLVQPQVRGHLVKLKKILL
ncbi:MAG: hypothetical protein IPN26_11660 [Bacteroidetes bacterium]|nr:hypothetical protein [Bacteroidota bacterium]